MSELIERLRALSRFEHSDCTIGDEAADEIEQLLDRIESAPVAYVTRDYDHLGLPGEKIILVDKIKVGKRVALVVLE